jgi:hypothetical protein
MVLIPIYSQLPSISGGRLLHPQPEDAPCRGEDNRSPGRKPKPAPPELRHSIVRSPYNRPYIRRKEEFNTLNVTGISRNATGSLHFYP